MFTRLCSIGREPAAIIRNGIYEGLTFAIAVQIVGGGTARHYMHS